MIFRRPLVNKILAGQKTQTRRPVKSGELRCRYRVGRRYAVQPGRGKAAVARIHVTDVHRQRLGDISPKDAQREGFKRRDQFVEYWIQMYGRFDEDQLVWVIEFEHEGEMPRFLAPSRDQHDYTADPSRALDLAETPPSDWRDPGLDAAKRRHAQVRSEETARFNARSIGAQVREAVRAAERAGVDVAEELAAIARLTERIEEKRRVAA